MPSIMGVNQGAVHNGSFTQVTLCYLVVVRGTHLLHASECAHPQYDIGPSQRIMAGGLKQS